MPYSTPPTFTDGNVLSASDLNTLADNDEYFYSLVSSNINVGFASEKLTTDSVSKPWWFYRVHRYLHYKVENVTNDTDRLKILVEGNTEFDDGTNRIGNYIWTGYIDLTTTTATINVGSYFKVEVDIDFLIGPNELIIHYFIQAPTTSI